MVTVDRQTVVAAAVVIFALLAASAIVQFGVFEYSPPSKPIPENISTADANAENYSVAFDRPVNDTQLFPPVTHDAMLVEEAGDYHLIVGTGQNRPQLRYTANATSSPPFDWLLEDSNYLTTAYEFDSIIQTDDQYVTYSNGNVYTAESVTSDNWTKQKEIGFRDVGAYYDEAEDVVHIYYEKGETGERGLSGTQIGHAVSPNGVDDWTVYPPVWTAPDGYGVGDYDIVVQDDLVFIFGDYSTHHPRYNVSVWVNDNFYTEFTQLDDPAIGYHPNSSDATDAYGVGDPTLIEYAEGQYVMVANGHATADAKPALHYYTGNISRTTP